MAYEIQLPLGTSGLTDIYAVGINPSGVVSANIPLAEIGTTGIYGNSAAISDLTQGLAYTIAAYQVDTLLAMAGPVVWNGSDFDDLIASDVSAAKTAAESSDAKLTSDRLNNIDSLANPDTFKAIIPSVVSANIIQVAGGTVANIAAFHGFGSSDRAIAQDCQHQLRSDEIKDGDTYQRLIAGTSSVILNKAVTQSGDRIEIVEAS